MGCLHCCACRFCICVRLCDCDACQMSGTKPLEVAFNPGRANIPPIHAAMSSLAPFHMSTAVGGYVRGSASWCVQAGWLILKSFPEHVDVLAFMNAVEVLQREFSAIACLALQQYVFPPLYLFSTMSFLHLLNAHAILMAALILTGC